MVKVVRFAGKIPNLTKVNSTVIHGRVIWLTKKNESGKESKVYIAYDFMTKIKLGVSTSKEKLIKSLEECDFSEVDRVAKIINGEQNEKN